MHAVRLTQLRSQLIDDEVADPSAGPGEAAVEILDDLDAGTAHLRTVIV